ncbi:chemotaxis response regulator protein-glutamate methylesterase [Bordetella hinzii]|uniref:chemotaxis response regulator protein-glutamate methylesterase n=1 Tax=Bordetella hinzii TaxID=103855 RepID=UPI000459FBA0|nr:chemotaxis response regulator protein-glutamate methylesterase [Bordetella hinzii]KCB48643.1 protein-glutamate methylesterase CheB [Bordetella hinzii 4161]KXA71704.1 chemotaxis response regulator protein-glutamate methylesterase [Bordetella hinzii LMG 13501]MCJ9710914.1 chemotaxis response regulator protein-glutamate methylesterase [Bordetella hinzii]QDJ33337.1 chemotaxis response regulator protein-glutamate methylesterase [Bordetella hinzii]QDJ37947.1 chemotaxis response regulator protein-
MRIGIVNDMPLAVEALRRSLAYEASLSVAWVASDGLQAVRLCAADTPDVVLMDLMMPGLDGVQATRRIMAQSPCAIIVVTSDVLRHTSMVFEAMGHGALDAVDTPVLGRGDPRAAARPLLRKIRNIGWLIGKKTAATEREVPPAPAEGEMPLAVIGASAGGPPSLAEVLRALPADFPAAVVIVQHVDAVFTPGMAAWLDEQSPMSVRLAASGEPPMPGTALLAGSDDHLAMRADGTLFYTADPRESLYRPSIDVFFHSVARHWRGRAAGVLLTGMGQDGARGLKALRDRGFLTLAQDRATSAVYGMPKAAAAMGAATEILPLTQIGPRLQQALAPAASRQLLD